MSNAMKKNSLNKIIITKLHHKAKPRKAKKKNMNTNKDKNKLR